MRGGNFQNVPSHSRNTGDGAAVTPSSLFFTKSYQSKNERKPSCLYFAPLKRVAQSVLTRFEKLSTITPLCMIDSPGFHRTFIGETDF